MSGYGGAQDYFRSSTGRSSSGGFGGFDFKPNYAAIPEVGNHWGGLVPMAMRMAGSTVGDTVGLNGATMQWATQQQQAPQLLQNDIAKQQMAMKHNFDLEKLRIQLLAQQKESERASLESGRSRDHALTMQARGFENDDYSSAADQFKRYGLGGYF